MEKLFKTAAYAQTITKSQKLFKLHSKGSNLAARGHAAFYQLNLQVWEFITASLEEKSSFQNRELENFASLPGITV